MKYTLVAIFIVLIIRSAYAHTEIGKQTLFVSKVYHLLQSKNYDKFINLKCNESLKLPPQLLSGESHLTAVREYESEKHLTIKSEFEIGICMESVKEKERCAVFAVINQSGGLCITTTN